MALPPELLEEPAETTVVGDIDAFMTYVESGRAQQDWQERLDLRLKDLRRSYHGCGLVRTRTCAIARQLSSQTKFLRALAPTLGMIEVP
jgi:hypothetical protein